MTATPGMHREPVPAPANLPPGWARTTLGEAYDIIGGGTPSTDHPEYWEGKIPWISSADIHGVTDVRPRRAVTPEGLRNSAASVVPKDSLIVVTRVGLGKVAKAPTDLCFSQDSQALVGASGYVQPDYALHYLSQALRAFKHLGRGTTINGVTKKQLKEVPLALPPFPEQRRIVAKIEELFSQLDAGVEELKKAKAQLKRYRQSVLKAAFDGKLTEEWRKAHKGKVEPASVLLERITAERKKTLGKKYKEPTPLDTSELPALPEGWTWASLGALARVRGGYAFKSSDYREEGVLLVRQTNLGGERVSTAGAVYLPLPMWDEYSEFAVRKGDILMGMSGSLGKRCVYDLDEPALQNQRTGLVMLDEQGMRRYLWHFLATMGSTLAGLGKGVGVQNVSGSQIEGCPIAVAPLQEQGQVADELDRLLSVADAHEKAIEAALKQAARLRQSILKRAFEGRLVPQDPSDEPADRLLERIRAEKAKHEARPKRSKRG